MIDVAQNTEYHLEALWTAIKQARTAADAAIERHAVARREEVAASNARHQAEKGRDVLQSALAEVLAGRARVEWREDDRRFAVTWLEGDAPPLTIPPATGQHEQRTAPPPNAAHVGSSVQGQVAR